jgi:hypothetical protein
MCFPSLTHVTLMLAWSLWRVTRRGRRFASVDGPTTQTIDDNSYAAIVFSELTAD